MNIGYSGRLQYARGAYPDRLEEVTGPLQYKVNPNYNYNCEGCLSTLGPRASFMGYGVTTPAGHVVAQSQAIVDIESDLSNRNLKLSKLKSQEVNFMDVRKYGAINAKHCSKFLDPMASRLTNPPCTYRDMAVNRFYDLDRDPQTNIFWDFNKNTKLEAKDNHIPNYRDPIDFDPSLPLETKNHRKCRFKYGATCVPK